VTRERPAAPPERSLELRIDALAAGGDGVGRAPDGRVVFVPFAAPGDRLRVRVLEERPRYARGEIEAVLEPGPARTLPRCPVFGECGGCAWQHVDYPAQLAAKASIVRDALARIGALVELPELEVVPSPAPYGYRSRARLLASRGDVGFRRRRSREPVPIQSCPLLAEPLDRALCALAGSRPASGEWELALGAHDTVRVAPLPPRGSAEMLELRVGGERLEVSPGVFVQANAFLQERLAGAVLDAAGRGGVALELFAGAGFFTLGLAKRFARVVAVEGDAQAARDLARNVAGAGLRHVRVIEARVETWLAAGEAQALAPEQVLLDPPRGGVGREAATRLARLPALRIVHVSCDPATLARDLAAFDPHGWRVARLQAFDLFPQTPHVEVLAVLERRA
jgi:23S rRNA (uracil1939-C5)-methyltransferase